MKKYILLASTSLIMCACGGNSPYTTPAVNNSSGTGGVTPNPTPPADSAAWKDFDFTGIITGGSNSSLLSITIDKVKKTITIRLPLPFDSSLAGILVNTPLPAINGASIAFGQLPDLTPVLSVTLPLASIAKGVTGLPTSSLPNGDPLPGMPTSSAPSTQFQLGSAKIPVYVYIGHMSVGLFLNTPFDPTIATHFQITDNNNNSVGAIYSIPYKSLHKDGGFFLNVNVPTEFTQLILSNL